ncbi:MAG: penicillin-binding protein 2, partial [Firmicutes bacterium]|nr:penicillin-binding protein 2 [Bacillota bacterium]
MLEYTRVRGLSGSGSSSGLNRRFIPGGGSFFRLASTPRKRLVALLFLLGAGFLVLSIRLFEVQIDQHEKYV